VRTQIAPVYINALRENTRTPSGGGGAPVKTHMVARIDRVQFGIWDPEDVVASAVCECTDPSTFSDNRMVRNGLNDDRMGIDGAFSTCRTCHGGAETCPGHFGCIRLSRPVYHVGFFNRVYSVLKRVCPSCGEVHKTNRSFCLMCDHPIPKLSKQIHSIVQRYSEEQRAAFAGNIGELVRTIPAIEARARLSRITVTRRHELGLPRDQPPEWMVLTAIPVMPPACRPSVLHKGRCLNDDLTFKYREIIKENNVLRDHLLSERPSHVIGNCVGRLQWHVSTLYDSEIHTLRKDLSWSSREQRKGIRQRLQGKDGRVRQNLMGKRVDFSARTVITADPNLDIDQVGVPFSIALNLTVPERVTRWNLSEMVERVTKGPEDLNGARYVTKVSDGARYDLSLSNRHRLHIGDLVERPLKDDDLVAMNRQPSLHKMSMMAHRVKRLPFSTFRLNLSVTSPYNAG
jgi:DNA-directed RNA polymerase II subunit RPB1